MATHINQENLKKHTIDFIIASIALSHNLTVISADKIYRDIMLLQLDLAMENWAA
jgi:predicted nucleic acid-binding protein